MSVSYTVYIGPYIKIPKTKDFDARAFCLKFGESLTPLRSENAPRPNEYLLPNQPKTIPARACYFSRQENEATIEYVGTQTEQSLFAHALIAEREELERMGVRFVIGWGILSWYY